MKATVTMDEGLAFEATADTGFTVRMDAHPNVGGGNSGFRPMEMVLMGLGGCTGMDVLSILRKKRQDVTGFEVKLEAEQAQDHPHVFTHINVKYIIRGRNIRVVAVERAIELSSTKYCPAQAMLDKTVEIEHTFEIIDIGEAQ